MDRGVLTLILRGSAVLLALALLAVFFWRARNRARVGPVKLRVHPRRVVRSLLLCLAVLAAATLFFWTRPGTSPEGLAILVLAPALLAFSPGFQDSLWGAAGVQRGWHARRYGELEEWRLIGEHLRWKLRGQWLATHVPASEHAGLRTVLEAAAPGRESSHGNAGFDPQRAAAAKSKS